MPVSPAGRRLPARKVKKTGTLNSRPGNATGYGNRGHSREGKGAMAR